VELYFQAVYQGSPFTVHAGPWGSDPTPSPTTSPTATEPTQSPTAPPPVPTPAPIVSTTTAPRVPHVKKVFIPADDDRACRGQGSKDNSASHYVLVDGVRSRQECQDACIAYDGCVGIEHNTRGRCEIWSRSSGIGATTPANGFSCHRYGWDTSRLEGVDGGDNRACRGSTPRDNSRAHYKLLHGMKSIDQCKIACSAANSCLGIEYHPQGRCEIWIRKGGIQASIRAVGYTCLRMKAS